MKLQESLVKVLEYLKENDPTRIPKFNTWRVKFEEEQHVRRSVACLESHRSGAVEMHVTLSRWAVFFLIRTQLEIF